MPALTWTGKNEVRHHHETVPIRTLELDEPNSHAKGIDGWKPSLDDNLIITGDNLDAMKALLPKYAGKVDVIYIDPPYNTGNEGWVYNDNVNSPMIKDWLGKAVGNDDLQRHDKWLCMMYPRLQLMKQLLKIRGVIFVSIDDNEVHHLRAVMDEIFESQNFVAEFVWKSRQNKDNRNITGVSVDHEYILAYSISSESRLFVGANRNLSQYSNPDNDPRGVWASANMVGLLDEKQRPNCHYDLIHPQTNINYGKPLMGWRYDKKTMQRLIEEERVIFPSSPKGRPRRKVFLNEIESLPNYSSVIKSDIYTRTGSEEIKNIFRDKYFEYPKPTVLLREFLEQVSNPNALVLDAFAGSGTTGHAVLKLNAEDGGNRKFILLQQPEALTEGSPAYEAGFKTVDDITRERIRRVIDGVPAAKDAQLKEGLGGSFTAVTLGQAIDPLKILKGEDLPSREALARYLYYTLELTSLPQVEAYHPTGFFAESESRCYYLHYEASKEWFLTQGANLTASQLEAISKHANKKGKEAFVLAPAYYISKEDLPKNVIAHHIPYDIQRLVFNSSEED